MKKEYAEYLLKKTKEDYSLITETFSQTRYSLWPELTFFRKYVQEGERILDLGCGNGRLFELFKNKNVEYIGVDNVEKLIEIARKKYPEAKFRVADCLNLPFPANFFDKIYSISVLHNIPSKEFRIQYLKEAKRVLKPEGFLILRVWDFWRRKAFPKLFLKYTFLKLIGCHPPASQLDFFDVFAPWKDSKGNIIIERYFHCFRKNELENLAKEVGFKIKKIWRAGKDPRTNIYLIAEK